MKTDARRKWRLLTMTEQHDLRKLYLKKARVSPRYPGKPDVTERRYGCILKRKIG